MAIRWNRITGSSRTKHDSVTGFAGYGGHLQRLEDPDSNPGILSRNIARREAAYAARHGEQCPR